MSRSDMRLQHDVDVAALEAQLRALRHDVRVTVQREVAHRLCSWWGWAAVVCSVLIAGHMVIRMATGEVLWYMPLPPGLVALVVTLLKWQLWARRYARLTRG